MMFEEKIPEGLFMGQHVTVYFEDGSTMHGCYDGLSKGGEYVSIDVGERTAEFSMKEIRNILGD
jgi:hypothetical protein